MSSTDSRGRRTDHGSEEDCVDFVRGQASSEATSRLQQHLGTGCRRCARAVRLWKAVFGAAGQEPSFEPPDEAVRQARGAFALRPPQPRLAASLAAGVALLFDSFREKPAFGGVRSASRAPRQLHYKAGRNTIRLRLEPAEDSERLFLVGQIVDDLDPRGPLKDIAVLALDGHRTLDRTLTNEMGEFVLEPAGAENLQLCVGIAEIGTFTVQPEQAPADASGALEPTGRRTRARPRWLPRR
jgi:hypothetical protein